MDRDELSRGDRFLKNFREASGDGDPLEVLVTDTEGFAEALAKVPGDLAEVLQFDADNGPSGPVFVNTSAFASAACDEDGRLLVADEAFRRWVMPNDRLSAALAKFDPKRPSISFLVEDRGKFIAVAAAPLVHSKNWPLSPDIKAFLEAGHAKIAVIARLDDTHNVTSTRNGIMTALRLTGLEARVCDGLVKAGGTRGAAALAGVTYETARAELKSAMKKAGVGSQAELVSLLIGLSSGELSTPQLTNVLRDVFNLTERQSSIAIHAANGFDRKEIAQIMGISAHSVKAELSSLFSTLNVDSIGQLSRAIAQIKALTALAGSSGIELNNLAHQSEPLQLLPRRGRKGRIAIADHGPVDGLPCMILHTATTGRHLPAAHVAALQAQGLRVIAFDRPGTGLTDMIEGPLLAQTALDMIDILDALSIERTCLVARGGSMVMAYFACYHADRFLRGVALNPEPRPVNDTAYLGFVGNVKRLVFRHPKLVAGLAKHLAQRAATSKVESLILRALAISPSDSATLSDPAFRAAYVRTTQQSALQSGAGFIAMSQYEPHTPDMPLQDGAMMTILYGEDDPVYFHQDGLDRWQAMWPNCTVQGVKGAGRLLQFQRPDLISKALLGAH
jgi:pimeloyl-ACP methyl ester carboxylesterase/DNA-binding CsgD family transcriptional regulator